MKLETLITIITLIASIVSIIISFMAFRKNEYKSIKKEGKNEGLMLSEISYIKESVDWMEKNLSLVDERYRDMLQRLAKLEGR